jgi:hypothetical protein
VTSAWNIGGTNKNDANNNLVRPVRMFTPCNLVDSCTSLSSTTKPTQAGTYWITPETFTLSAGDLSNYLGVRYLPTTVTINRVAQTPQQLPYYNPTYPTSLNFFIGGGNGTGTTTYTLLGGGNASGCAFDYKNLATTSIGTCQVRVVKAADRNYLADTSTAYIYFVDFVVNQPAPAVGSGATIALTGQTSIVRDPNQAPTISEVRYVPFDCLGQICVPQHWEIIGAGFGSYGNTDLVVKFWRNKELVWFDAVSQLNYVVDDTKIWVRQSPVGATTGKITVTTANGIAVSPENWVAP